ncbi:hypothetical protein SODG_006613 [Sodalis praecaptivus]
MLNAKSLILLMSVCIGAPCLASVPKDKIPSGADCDAALSPNTASQVNPNVDISLCDPTNARRAGISENT